MTPPLSLSFFPSLASHNRHPPTPCFPPLPRGVVCAHHRHTMRDCARGRQCENHGKKPAQDTEQTQKPEEDLDTVTLWSGCCPPHPHLCAHQMQTMRDCRPNHEQSQRGPPSEIGFSVDGLRYGGSGFGGKRVPCGQGASGTRRACWSRPP